MLYVHVYYLTISEVFMGVMVDNTYILYVTCQAHYNKKKFVE